MMNDSTSSGTWIGPTQCDQERASRQTDVDKTWEMVKPMLQGNNFKPSVYGMMSLAIDLLRESLNCYQNGAYLAVCGMCRASTEALLYLATTRKPVNEYETVEIKENNLRQKRGQFLKDAIASNFVDEDDVKEIERIWQVGDFAMHIHQKIDKNMDYYAKRAAENVNLDTDILKGWSNREEALATMNMTARVMSKVLNKVISHVSTYKS